MNAILPTTSSLSPLQQAVVDRVLDPRGGSINVVARAGCGKTHLVVVGVVNSIYHARPRDCMAVMTYNTAATKEVNVRLVKLGLTNWKQVKTGTCHSFGFNAWRKVAPDVKIDADKVFKIIDRFTQGDSLSDFTILRGVINHAVSFAKQRAFGFLTPATDRLAWFDLVDHFGLEDDLAEGYTVDQLVDLAIRVLQESLRLDYQVIDFDDMILAPLVHKARFWTYDWVILDEEQDTNPARRALALAMMKPRWGRFVGVGDDRQAIYGFTGADADAMDLMAKAVNATTMPLNITFRCPKAVVREAQKLVPDYTAAPEAPEGVMRELPYAVETTEGNSRYWFEGEDFKAGDFILCRNTKPLVEEAYNLIRAGIGCLVEGREIGKGLVDLATRWSRIKTLGTLSEKLTEYKAKEIAKWLAKGREEKADAVDDRVETLQAIIGKVQGEGGSTVDELRIAITSLFGNMDDDNAPDVVRLMSIHKSKGREAPRVYMLGRRRFLPSRYARKPWHFVQEENLEYVGLTRAQQEFIDVVLA